MVPGVFEVSSLAGGADSVLCPAQEHRDLAHVEWPCGQFRAGDHTGLECVGAFYAVKSKRPPERRSITALTATMIDEVDISKAETSGRSDQPHSG